jgi:hypothetical protein
VMCHPKRRKASAMIARALGTSALGVGGAFGLLAGAAPAAGAAEPTQQELMDQVKALQAKVERLEAQQQQQTAQVQQSGGGAAATVDSVLRDADRRSQLLQPSGFTAGIDRGQIVIRSEDGNFEIVPNFQFQARYALNYREEDNENPVNGNADVQSGFEISRMKIAFDGHAFSPNLLYRFQWDSRNGSSLTLEDAFITYKFADTLAVKLGQYKDVTFHEEITSSKRQLAVDRSLVNEALGGGQTDYIQGVALVWDNGSNGMPLRAEVGYTDGPNTDNTNFTETGGNAVVGLANPNWGAYARAEWLAMGRWSQYDDFTGMGNDQNLLVIGGGAFFAQAGGSDALFHTVDAQFETAGTNPISLYAAYLGVYRETSEGTDGGVYDFGFLAQAGYMLNERVELFARYDFTDLDSPTGSGENQFHEITAGLNYYFRGHAAKFTADVSWLPNGAPIGSQDADILAPSGSEDQIVVRAQFQLLI